MAPSAPPKNLELAHQSFPLSFPLAGIHGGGGDPVVLILILHQSIQVL